MSKEALSVADAIEIFGNKKRLAEAAGVTRQAVQKWGVSVPQVRMAKLRRYKKVKKHLSG